MTEAEVQNMILKCQRECSDEYNRRMDKLLEVSSRNTENIAVICTRLGNGNKKFEEVDKDIDDLKAEVKANSLSLAKIAGFIAAGGAAGAALFKVIA
jgi:hypothetical protein